MECFTPLCSFGAGLWSVLHHSLHLELVYGVFNTSLCIWSWFMECLTPLCAFGAELMKCLSQSHEWIEKDVGLMHFCT